jgi:glycogen debranching enzyme
LFLMALDEHWGATGSDALLRELRPAWEAAVEWLASHQQVQGGDDAGLIAFQPSGSGLLVQSWKDSNDSMVHADGSQALPPLAVAEVQGYAFAAFGAVAGFCEALGDTARAAAYRERARLLGEVFDRRFWLDDLGTYAMALDGSQQPLRVLSSDPGHLLWCGIVPAERAARLVGTLMSPALWSGWGLRTLGSSERAFNPASYHNGSVWPHDTALFAAGLAGYGFHDELRVVTQGLFDLAASQPLGRLPELVSGHTREPGLGPVLYTHACRPQAWAAAALPFLARLRNQAGASRGAQP